MNSSQIQRLVDDNDFAAAARELEGAFKSSTLEQPECELLAMLCRRVGKRELAYKFFLRARDFGSASEDLLFQIALTQVDLSIYIEAYDLFTRLTEINPGRSEFWQWRGRTATFLPRPEAPSPDTNVVTGCYKTAIALETPSEWFVNEVLKFALNYSSESIEVVRELQARAATLSPPSQSVLRLYSLILMDAPIEPLVQALFDGSCRTRSDVQAIQRFCREVFIDPLIKNQHVSFRALYAFLNLARSSDAKFGHDKVRPDFTRISTDLIHFLKRAYATDTLVVVQTSSQYYSAFRLWYQLYGRLQIDYKLLIVALDGRAVTQVLEDFPWLADKVFLVPLFPATRHIYGDGGTENFYWYLKNLLVRTCVAAGFNVIQTDADAFWKKDISAVFEYEFRYLGADIVAQQEGGLPRAIATLWGFSLCAGFWGIRAGARSVSFMDDLLQYALYLWDDQVALNTLLLDSGASWQGEPGGRCATDLRLSASSETLRAIALPEQVATRNIWDLDKIDRAVIHGQYFKHEEWVDHTIATSLREMSRATWGRFQYDAYRELASNLIRDGYHEAAERHLGTMIELCPNDEAALLQSGVVNKILGDDRRAMERFDGLLALKPQHVHGLMWSGLACVGLGDFDGALGRFDAALAVEPEHVNGYIQKALVLEQIGRLDDAIGSLEEGHARTGGNAGLAEHLSRLHAVRAR